MPSRAPISDGWRRGPLQDGGLPLVMRLHSLDPADVAPLRGSSDVFSDYFYGPGRYAGLNLHTAWDCIDFLVQTAEGTPHWRMGNVIHVGTPAPDPDLCNAAIRDATETAQLARRLEARSMAELSDLFDVAELDRHDVYPGQWRERGGEGRRVVLDAFTALRRYALDLAGANRALMTVLG